MRQLFFTFLVLTLTTCQNQQIHIDLDKLSSDGVIDIGTHNVRGEIGKIFSKYVYTTAPNGGRISIFGTSGVSDDQMVYARNILELYFNSEGEVYKKVHKEAIANSMANRRCAMIFFDTEEQSQANRDRLLSSGYSLQSLYATESLGSGNRDASYEEILHLVHNYGIAPSLFEYQDKLQKANDDAKRKGLWIPWEDRGLPSADFDDEYLAALMDCYLGLWQGQGGTFFGAYKPSSQAEMKTRDPVGYQLIRELFGNIKPVEQ